MALLVDRAEYLVVEAAKTRGTLFAFREPLWVTWPLSRFGASLSLPLRAAPRARADVVLPVQLTALRRSASPTPTRSPSSAPNSTSSSSSPSSPRRALLPPPLPRPTTRPSPSPPPPAAARPTSSSRPHSASSPCSRSSPAKRATQAPRRGRRCSLSRSAGGSGERLRLGSRELSPGASDGRRRRSPALSSALHLLDLARHVEPSPPSSSPTRAAAGRRRPSSSRTSRSRRRLPCRRALSRPRLSAALYR